MNIKDKLTICLVLVLVIALGFVLKSDASGSVMGQTSDKGLALLAKNDINTFIMTNPDSSSWFTQNLDVHVGTNQKDATIAQSSAACMFHEESYTQGSLYNIVNVININWDPSINDYHAYGWWPDSSKPNGIAQGELTSLNRDYNKLLQLDVFLQAMYNAYTSNKTYYNTTEKSAMKSYFYKGIQAGGFLTVDDGVGLNIDPNFLGYTAQEALSYKDSSSSYNAQDLINQYSANNNTGVGLAINGESTCIKEKDTDGNYTIFGPFNIHFIKPINSISIVGDAKSHTDYNGGQIYYSTSYNQYDTAEWSNQLSNIPANTNFYIKISDSGQEFYNQSPNIKITFNQKAIQTYQGRMILLKSGGHGQNLMIYAARKNDPYTASVQYSVEKKDNTLRIVKYGVNGSQETRQTEVGFIINHAGKGYLKYNNGDQIVKIGKMDYNETDFSWISDRNAATIFETVNTDDGWLGYFQITKMPVGEYYIGEVYNKNQGYEDSLITRCILERYEGDTLIDDMSITDVQQNVNISGYTEHNLQVMNVTLEEDGYTKALRVYDSLQSDFNIYIDKENPSGSKLKGAEFKIKVYNGSKELGWLYRTNPNSNEPEYKYDNSYSKSTTWNTSEGTSENYTVYAEEKGILEILNLNPNYKYKIFEFKPATNYLNLLAQTNSGMKVTIDGTTTRMSRDNNYVYAKNGIPASVNCGTVSYENHGGSATVEVVNVDSSGSPTPTVDISGVVWMDRYVKTSNSQYDSGEGLSGVKVYLKLKSTNKIVKYNGKDYVQTDSNGNYTFNGSITGITSGTLSNYYIEIAYNGLGSNYHIVEYCKSGVASSKQSRAKYESAGKAWTDSVDNSSRTYMNIGIVADSSADESITKDIAYIKTKIKGEEYLYKYGEINRQGAFTVDVGNEGYYRTIYSSDIIYNKTERPEPGKELQVYITYAIKVTNNSRINSSYYNGNIYYPDNKISDRYTNHERFMKVNVYDQYNADYYELVNNDTSIITSSMQRGKWTKNSTGIAKYQTELSLNNATKSGNSTTLYVTYQLKDAALTKILQEGTFTDEKTAYIEGAHYRAKHKLWYEYWAWRGSGKNRRYVHIRDYYKWYQSDSKSNTTYNTQVKRYSDPPPGMRFSIYDYDTGTVAQRTISGKVFEDNRVGYESTGEVIGNGKYDGSGSLKESSVQNVTVELLQANSNKITGEGQTIASRYIYDETQENKYIKKTGDQAKETTLQDGTYTFTGIVPGEYYVRFTYGDGNQTIIKTNPSGTEPVTAYEYKSTVITNSSLIDMIKRDRKKQGYSNYYWYRNTSILSNRYQYSTAVDILGDREKLNDQYSKTYNMRAYTPTFKISLENESTSKGMSDEVDPYKIENMNFGIIDTPEIELGFEKVMTNIKVTNTAGQIIVDGNPAKQEIKYLSNLDNKEAHLTQGSDYAKIELKDEELYGAKLEITYAITIINNSDVNYYENPTSESYGHYYMFGTKSKEANITIDQVDDYLDEKLTLIGNDHIISNKDTYKDDYNILNINGGDWKRLYTQRKPATNTRPTEDTATIIVTRTLSHEDTNKDTSFENQAEVMKMHMTDEPKLIENVNKHLESQYKNYFTYEVYGVDFVNPSGNNSLTIIPPTGADLMTTMIYITAIAIAGIIITIGIIVIKKKVLNK